MWQLPQLHVIPSLNFSNWELLLTIKRNNNNDQKIPQKTYNRIKAVWAIQSLCTLWSSFLILLRKSWSTLTNSLTFHHSLGLRESSTPSWAGRAWESFAGFALFFKVIQTHIKCLLLHFSHPNTWNDGVETVKSQYNGGGGKSCPWHQVL